MKISISAEGGDLNARAGGRFGTSAYFIIVDTQTMRFEAMENPGAAGQHAAGIQAIILAISQKVDAVLTGFCSPTAAKYLSENGIQVVTGIDGTVGGAVRQYRKQIRFQKHLDMTKPHKIGINKESLISALKMSAKQLAYLFPVLIGVILLIGLFNVYISKGVLKSIFSGNAILDILAGSFFGSVMAGNPITSYVIGGELLASGVSLFGVTAFLVAWVSIGLVQLPAEMAALGRKFALVRNTLFFILSMLISILTVSLFHIVTGSFL